MTSAGSTTRTRAPVAPQFVVAASRHPFVRFLFVGGANTLFSFAVFRLVLAGLGQRPGAPALAQVCGYLAGVATGYVAHRRVTFRNDGVVARQLPRFVAVHGCMLTLTTLALETLVTYEHVPTAVAWFVTTAFATVGNFVLLRRFVFTA